MYVLCCSTVHSDPQLLCAATHPSYAASSPTAPHQEAVLPSRPRQARGVEGTGVTRGTSSSSSSSSSDDDEERRARGLTGHQVRLKGANLLLLPLFSPVGGGPCAATVQVVVVRYRCELACNGMNYDAPFVLLIPMLMQCTCYDSATDNLHSSA